MNLEAELVFIVGPGSSGKSTTGKLLAQRLGFGFVDIDFVFCDRVGLIGDYVRDNGYRRYCEDNSQLFEDLLREHPTRTVFPLSSGFLVHEDSPDLVKKHIRRLRETGVSILLLPSRSLKESMEVIIPRQMSRGYPDLDEEKEKTRLASRHPKYKRYGDIKIFSYANPEVITDQMITELNKIGLPG